MKLEILSSTSTDLQENTNYRRSITVWLVSSFTRLIFTNEENMKFVLKCVVKKFNTI